MCQGERTLRHQQFTYVDAGGRRLTTHWYVCVGPDDVDASGYWTDDGDHGAPTFTPLSLLDSLRAASNALIIAGSDMLNFDAQEPFAAPPDPPGSEPFLSVHDVLVLSQRCFAPQAGLDPPPVPWPTPTPSVGQYEVWLPAPKAALWTDDGLSPGGRVSRATFSANTALAGINGSFLSGVGSWTIPDDGSHDSNPADRNGLENVDVLSSRMLRFPLPRVLGRYTRGVTLDQAAL